MFTEIESNFVIFVASTTEFQKNIIVTQFFYAVFTSLPYTVEEFNISTPVDSEVLEEDEKNL